jgi:hypothetical protein
LKSNEFSPTQVKSWVHDALSTRNRTVYFMRPCIRVQYHQNEYEAFHIDLAVYAREDNILTGNSTFYISKGLVNSNRENVLWEAAQPFELLSLIRKRFNDTEELQNRGACQTARNSHYRARLSIIPSSENLRLEYREKLS